VADRQLGAQRYGVMRRSVVAGVERLAAGSWVPREARTIPAGRRGAHVYLPDKCQTADEHAKTAVKNLRSMCLPDS
jgi:hypothetical protein